MPAKRNRPIKLWDFGTGQTFEEVVKSTGVVKLPLLNSASSGAPDNSPSSESINVPISTRHAIPEAYRSHELVAGETFYVLPIPLLVALGRSIPAFVKQVGWQMEHDLSKAAVLHGDNACVGFANGQPVAHDLLVERKPFAALTIPKEFAQIPGWKGMTDQHMKNAVSEGDKRIDWIRKSARAYCGWLMTNPSFLREYKNFENKWSAHLRKYGFPILGPLPQNLPKEFFSGPSTPATPSDREFGEETKRLCIRWQLKTIIGPYLPEPLRPQFPVASLHLLTDTMREGGPLIYLPRSFALMGEQELRSLLEDVIRGAPSAEHLRGWATFAASNRHSKGGEFDRFGRLFELQHYWRILYGRWNELLHRKKFALIQAFAAFYGLSGEQIKNDVTKILAKRDL